MDFTNKKKEFQSILKQVETEFENILKTKDKRINDAPAEEILVGISQYLLEKYLLKHLENQLGEAVAVVSTDADKDEKTPTYH